MGSYFLEFQFHQVQEFCHGFDEGALRQGQQDQHRRLLSHRGPSGVDLLHRQLQLYQPLVGPRRGSNHPLVPPPLRLAAQNGLLGTNCQTPN